MLPTQRFDYVHPKFKVTAINVLQSQLITLKCYEVVAGSLTQVVAKDAGWCWYIVEPFSGVEIHMEMDKYELEMDGNGAQFVKRLWIGLDLGKAISLKRYNTEPS